MSLVEKLKTRWNIKSTTQFVMIMVVFSLTGFTAVYLKDIIYDLLGVTNNLHIVLRVLIWLVTIFPLYYVFLLLYGTILGQGEFFRWFAKKSFSRFIRSKKKHTSDS